MNNFIKCNEKSNNFMKNIFSLSFVYVWQDIYFRSEEFHVI